MEYQFNKKYLSKIQRIKYLFLNPTKLFEEINYSTNSPFYLFIILLCSTISASINSIFLRESLKQTIVKSLRNSYLMTYANEYAEMLSTPFAQGLMSIVYTIVGLFFISLFYYIITMLLSHKEKYKPEFREVFNIYLIACLATAIGDLLKSLFMIITNNHIFLSTIEKSSLKGILINKFDPFLFWKMFLLTIGFSIVFKYSKKKSALAIILIWIASISIIFL